MYETSSTSLVKDLKLTRFLCIHIRIGTIRVFMYYTMYMFTKYEKSITCYTSVCISDSVHVCIYPLPSFSLDTSFTSHKNPQSLNEPLS